MYIYKVYVVFYLPFLYNKKLVNIIIKKGLLLMNHLIKPPITKSHKLSMYKFILPSLIGIILFMLPLSIEGNITIPIALLSNRLQVFLTPYILKLLLFIIVISAVGALTTKLFKPPVILKHSFFSGLFNISWPWLLLRLLALFIILTVLLTEKKLIPSSDFTSMIVSSDTGLMVLQDLLPVLFSIFFFAGIFLPLLLNFGLLEFVGAALVKVMRPLFGLPGRAAIDCMTSWLGDGTIGILLTNKQYSDGFYTEREAAIIGTNFSLVSITFSLVIINTVGLGQYFVPFYFTVCIACFIAAIIIPKLPPLSNKKDILFDGSLPSDSSVKNEPSGLKYGFNLALDKANSQNLFRSIFIEGGKNVIDMWVSVIPTVLSVGTLALIIATYTPLFKILGLPFIPLLQILGIPEAVAASQTLVAGFADMLLPSVLATSIDSDMTRFIIASISVTQLIYLSEVGSLLLSSKIPIKLWELFIIFIERTCITLPIVALLAHLIF